MRVTVQAELGIPAETYLLERDGAAFRSFIEEEMSLLEYEITECWKEGSVTKIKLESKPDVGAWIPSTLKSKIPDAFVYYDEVTYDPDKLCSPPYQLDICSVAPFLGEKGQFASRTIIEPVGPDRCRHILEQNIEFNGLWGLGAVAKKLAKKSLESSFADMPGIIDKWVQLRQELLQTPHGRERLLAGRPRVEGVEWMDEQVAAIKQHGAPGRHHHKGRQHRGEGPSPSPSPGRQSAGNEGIPAVRSPFAVAAAEQGSGGGEAFAGQGQQAQPPAPPAQQERPPDRRGAGQLAAAVSEDGGAFYDAAERQPSRQSTAGTAFFTPTASPAASASTEVPPPPQAAAGDSTAGRAQPQPLQAQPPQGRGRVQVARLPETARKGKAGGGAEEAGGEAAGGEGASSDREGSSAGYDGSREDEDQGSKASEEDEREWARTSRWRAFYLQRGLTPTRTSRVLPERLVKHFVGNRPGPVHAEKLTAGGDRAVAAGKGGGGIRRLFASCFTRPTAVE